MDAILAQVDMQFGITFGMIDGYIISAIHAKVKVKEIKTVFKHAVLLLIELNGYIQKSLMQLTLMLLFAIPVAKMVIIYMEVNALKKIIVFP